MSDTAPLSLERARQVLRVCQTHAEQSLKLTPRFSVSDRNFVIIEAASRLLRQAGLDAKGTCLRVRLTYQNERSEEQGAAEYAFALHTPFGPLSVQGGLGWESVAQDATIGHPCATKGVVDPESLEPGVRLKEDRKFTQRRQVQRFLFALVAMDKLTWAEVDARLLNWGTQAAAPARPGVRL